ncbi:uncharacterized protein (DUF58 family) [Microbacterium endophyticum]|uniref:Uncharacterized protein (DUF58 family) n=1 Tax=Microbacterium endophyticum TaxID=1526412 RepID=A0A7W4V1J5_9MICO|nr:DUF58 domain-containing protein [Microbacterium endophyticum]MBB2975167.1 uncharacterized protein (DUF58 family) [Microbacterium endophyticum]NIK37293.1 uncharacterized protein (DUF58 family) [Microbacterium endophyticum]
MRRFWPLTVRGTGALVLVIAFTVAANELGLIELLAFAVLLLALLTMGALSVWLRRRHAQVTRALSPDVPSIGADATVTVRVTAESSWPASSGTWTDALPGDITADATGVFPVFTSRRDGRHAEVTYELNAVHRGIHWIGPLRLKITDTFGLIRRQHTLGEPTKIVVAPTVVDLGPTPGFSGDSGGTLSPLLTQRGQGADNLIARPYASGDSMRRIHWRASAHRNELMVREEEQESTPEATVVCDRAVIRFDPAALDATGADADFEVIVSATLSVTARLVRDGYTVAVIDSDGSELCAPIAGGDTTAVEELVLDFATITARSVRAGVAFAGLAQEVAGRTIGPLVVVTGALTSSDTTALAALAGHSHMPALITTTRNRETLQSATGWRTATVSDDSELAEAWRTVTSTAEVAHGIR